jgi:hypothetical protein
VTLSEVHPLNWKVKQLNQRRSSDRSVGEGEGWLALVGCLPTSNFRLHRPPNVSRTGQARIDRSSCSPFNIFCISFRPLRFRLALSFDELRPWSWPVNGRVPEEWDVNSNSRRVLYRLVSVVEQRPPLVKPRADILLLSFLLSSTPSSSGSASLAVHISSVMGLPIQSVILPYNPRALLL